MNSLLSNASIKNNEQNMVKKLLNKFSAVIENPMFFDFRDTKASIEATAKFQIKCWKIYAVIGTKIEHLPLAQAIYLVNSLPKQNINST